MSARRNCASAGLPALDVAGSGKLGGGRTTVDLAINAGAGNGVRVTGSAPLAADGALDLKIDGRLDAGLANALLSAGGRNASGAVTVAMQLRGTLAKPDARGTLTLANGAFSDDQTGFKLTGVSALVTANGDTIRIDRLGGGDAERRDDRRERRGEARSRAAASREICGSSGSARSSSPTTSSPRRRTSRSTSAAGSRKSRRSQA